jgi:hypothetical protein
MFKVIFSKSDARVEFSKIAAGNITQAVTKARAMLADPDAWTLYDCTAM